MAGRARGLGVGLLGPVRVRRDAESLDLGPVRRQALLVALVLRAGTVVSYGQLLGDVWGTEPPGSGHRVLPSYVYALRRTLDPAGTGPARSLIRGERGGYSFAPGAGGVWTDVGELGELAAEARQAQAAGAPAELLELCGRGLALFRGEPLSGLPGPLAAAERDRLVQQRRSFQRLRAEALIGLGRYADALDGLVGAGPPAEDEAFAALRMRALYGSGRQAEALEVFRRTRAHLVAELGVEPGEELRRVHRGVLRQDSALLLGWVGARGAELRALERGGALRGGRDDGRGGGLARRDGLSGGAGGGRSALDADDDHGGGGEQRGSTRGSRTVPGGGVSVAAAIEYAGGGAEVARELEGAGSATPAPETVGPEAAGPEAVGSEAVGSAPGPEGAGSAAPRPGAPGSAEPGQEAGGAGALGVAATGPQAPGPAARGQEAAGSAAARPELPGPGTVGPAAGPESVGPEAAGPEAAGPEAAGPESVGPETVGDATGGAVTVSAATARSGVRAVEAAGSAACRPSAPGPETAGTAVAGSAARRPSALGAETAGTAVAGSAARRPSALGAETAGTAVAGSAARRPSALGAETAGTAVVGSAEPGPEAGGAAALGVAATGPQAPGPAARGLEPAGSAAPPPAATGRPNPRRPRIDLPGDAVALVGRERELEVLTSHVPGGGVSVVAVDGTAGVGKSALLVRAAWRLHERYPDGCLFIDLHTHAAAHESVGTQRALYRLLRAISGSDDELPEEPDELVAAWRAATSALRLLVVVDDAPGTAEVRPLLPAGPGSTLLVASRRHLPGLDADVRLTVEPLGTDAALDLLRHLLGPERADREPEAARELARRCGGLPLALRIAGARLQHRASWTTAHLVGRMAEDDGGLRELSAGDRSVEAAIRQSYDQLGVGLQRCFRASGLSPTAEFDALTPAAMLGCSRADAEHLLEQLVDASLLQEPKPGRYRLHDLVRVHAGQLATATPTQAAADRAAVLHLYTAAGRITAEWGPAGFPSGPDVTGAPFADWVEAAQWLNAAGAGLVDVVAYAVAAGMPDHACWIAEGLSDHLLRQGRHHECRAALELALGCADTAGDRRMPSSLRNHLGMAAIHQGRYGQAHAWFADALRLASRPGEGDPRDRARAIAGLGVAEWPLGRTEEAVARLHEATRLAHRLGDDWLAMVSASNLGALHSRGGEHERALGHYADALAYAEKTGRPGVIGKALCFAGDAQVALGRYAEAAGLLGRAAELARESDDSALLALSLSSLGIAELGRGDVPRAVSFHEEAVSTLTGHASTWLQLLLRTRLGTAYAAAHRRTEAHHEFRTALALPGAADYPREHALAREGLRD
ncbi:BTAD domain-containing putative transcriptional regulator [Streptomyces tritici]|uniref:BTAD domain-containing putative transcriptional regulator n=1 Tax=Streptomyces tritici TaxID=2054410 RepID=UPI003AF0EA29